MNKIAIIGGGGTGKSIAADLSLSGYEVILYEEPEYKAAISDVVERGGVEITGALGEKFVKIGNITMDINKALCDVEIIFIATLATRHARIAELCAPILKDGQLIIIATIVFCRDNRFKV
jgi:opine dehydrogenase